MKKSMFLGFAVATLMTVTACSTDEIVDMPVSQNSVIKFSTFVDKNTRATEITSANIGDGYDFAVLGYLGTEMKMNRVHVYKFTDDTTVGFDGVWQYANPVNWEVGTWYFHALSPWNAKGGNSSGTSDNNWTQFKIDDSSMEKTRFFFDNSSSGGDSVEDLLYAFAKKEVTADNITNPGDVDLTFRHLLSRVRITFDNAIAGASVTISYLDISGMIEQAHVTVDNTAGATQPVTWDVNESQAWSGIYWFDYDEVNNKWEIPEGKSASTEPLFFIPAKLGDGSIGKDPTRENYVFPDVPFLDYWIWFSFTVNYSDGSTAQFESQTAQITDISMYDGWSYDFHITLTDGNEAAPASLDEPNAAPISFKVTVDSYNEGWNTEDDPSSDDVDIDGYERAGSQM